MGVPDVYSGVTNFASLTQERFVLKLSRVHICTLGNYTFVGLVILMLYTPNVFQLHCNRQRWTQL